MKALILAGGFGTRLRPLSCTRPKQLFPIANRPMIDWMLEGLARAGVEEAVLAVNYMADEIARRLGSERHGIKLRYSKEDRPLGTGGPLRLAREALCDGCFLMLNGDVFSNIDYRGLLGAHSSRRPLGALATITLFEVEDPSRFGVVELAEPMRIVRFVEKPRREEAPSRLINAGAYALEPEVIDYVKEGKCSIEREVFPRLAAEGRLYGFEHRGLWVDIGKPEDFMRANFAALDMLAPKEPAVARSARVSKGAEIIPPAIIGEGAEVAENAKVGPYAAVGANAYIGRGAKVERSVVFDSARIGQGSLICGSIIGEGALIGEGARVEGGCAVGDRAELSDGVQLINQVKVCPFKEVSESVYGPAFIA